VELGYCGRDKNRMGEQLIREIKKKKRTKSTKSSSQQGTPLGKLKRHGMS
jgi:hypothetical protein